MPHFSPRAQPTWRMVVVFAGLVLACVGFPATPATAHSQLVEATPANGSRLNEPPTSVVLRFNELIQTHYDLLSVTGPDGKDLVSAPAEVAGGTLTQPISRSSTGGSYHVSYRVISADGHPVSGEVSFELATQPTTAAPITIVPPTSSPTPAEHSATPHDAKAQKPDRWTDHIGHNLPTIAIVVACLVMLIVEQRRRSRAGK